MTDEIYIALIDEDVNVWRPAPAWKVGQRTYIVLRPQNYEPDVERWEFPPGSVVECEPRTLSDGPAIVAVRSVETNKQTA